MTAAVVSPFSTPADNSGTDSDARDRDVTCVLATAARARDIHLAIRAAVFVAEQAVFTGTDRDAHDDHVDTLHVLALVGRTAVGAVRLYPVDGELGLWKGDRLAVLRGYRGRKVGAPLVRFAVAAAGQRGGRRMVAHIQPPNVTFFEALGWRCFGDVVDYVGLPHQPMCIDLTEVGEHPTGDARSRSPER